MDAFINSLLGGSIVSVVAGILLYVQKERLTAAIKHEFEVTLDLYRSNRAWKETSLEQLLGPLFMQFDRTNRAMDRWKKQNLYLEQMVIREGNLTMRDLLLKKGHLIPPDLWGHAGGLIEHFDLWLEELERLRGDKNPEPTTEFVFVGPKGFPFPKDAETAFCDKFKQFQADLYETS